MLIYLYTVKKNMRKKKLDICMVTSEFAPFAKAGGLGDCVASLSNFISNTGHNVKVILPKYANLSLDNNIFPHQAPMTVNLGYGSEYCRLWEYKHNNLSVYFIEFDRYYNRQGIYKDQYGDFLDNHERFGFLVRAAIDLCYYLNWQPDIFHCHDWTSGLLPVLLDTTDNNEFFRHTASIFTIHNLQHHGYSPKSLLQFLNIPEHVFRPDGIEAFGQINSMKAGLYFSTKITTVSKNYAQEIQTVQYGCGLHDILKFRAGDLIGIQNGIDDNIWDPEIDKLIPANFSCKNLSGKSKCKSVLQQQCCLNQNHNTPIFSAIARLYPQKGIDILASIIPDILRNMDVQICILGSGDYELEHKLWTLSQEFPGRMYVYIGYNEQLAHLIEAGSDFFIMPSRFEPCGLNQMYSMKYGTLPIVHATGGLKDTVQNFDEISGNGTGFVFNDLTQSALYNTIGWACHTYYKCKPKLLQLQRQAMKQDFSWENFAKEYVQVYNWSKDLKR